MGLNRTMCDRKPESASALPPSVERIKDARQVLRLDARAIIDHPYPDRMAERNLGRDEVGAQGIRHYPDRNSFCRITDLYGVQNEVQEGPVQ